MGLNKGMDEAKLMEPNEGIVLFHPHIPVSYTHLDVYKRQLRSLISCLDFSWNVGVQYFYFW